MTGPVSDGSALHSTGNYVIANVLTASGWGDETLAFNEFSNGDLRISFFNEDGERLEVNFSTGEHGFPVLAKRSFAWQQEDFCSFRWKQVQGRTIELHETSAFQVGAQDVTVGRFSQPTAPLADLTPEERRERHRQTILELIDLERRDNRRFFDDRLPNARAAWEKYQQAIQIPVRNVLPFPGKT